MALPTISTINFSGRDDREVQAAIRAVNRQILDDFAPIWGSAWELQLHASPLGPADEVTLARDPVKGDGVLYIVDPENLSNVLGYHSINAAEIPFGFVFATSPNWSETLSHEALEMIIDPTVNILVPGPDPRDPGADKVVLHAYEVCDAVERTSYSIDSVRVSNFVTQTYFRAGDPPGTRNDFIGVGVPSFGATPGSHLAFFDFEDGWVTFFGHVRDQTARVFKRQAARLNTFSTEKPERPEEDELEKILQECKSSPLPQNRDKPEGGLERVRAITRTGRYRECARKLATIGGGVGSPSADRASGSASKRRGGGRGRE